mmetsp:Transcript_124/g.429  ORF Transcript_124/g.429 Transcript_124/m.429 type:complete len:277 (+) Transcript_124:450-1280(+)
MREMRVATSSSRSASPGAWPKRAGYSSSTRCRSVDWRSTSKSSNVSAAHMGCRCSLPSVAATKARISRGRSAGGCGGFWRKAATKAASESSSSSCGRRWKRCCTARTMRNASSARRASPNCRRTTFSLVVSCSAVGPRWPTSSTCANRSSLRRSRPSRLLVCHSTSRPISSVPACPCQRHRKSLMTSWPSCGSWTRPAEEAAAEGVASSSGRAGAPGATASAASVCSRSSGRASRLEGSTSSNATKWKSSNASGGPWRGKAERQRCKREPTVSASE